MTDAQLIEWLRAKAVSLRATRHDRLAGPFDEAAARLEQLSGAAKGSPLPPGREAEIRRDWRGHGAVEELLAALGWERGQRLAEASVCQDYLSEPPSAAGERLGVARALAFARERTEQWHQEGIAGRALRSLLFDVEKACGPAEIPPHLVTHARMLRLEAVLERIAGGVGDADDVSWMDSSLMWQRIAREALENNP